MVSASINFFTPSQYVHYRILRTVMVCILRTFLVLAAWGVAVGIPDFGILLAVVGSLAPTILAFVLPPLFHLALKWRLTSVPKKIFHISLLVVGLLASTLATGINLYEAIENGGGPTSCHTILSSCSSSNGTGCNSY